MKPVEVMVVEDSATVRELLCSMVARDPRLRVVAATRTAEEAVRLVPEVRPDVISMDIRLPGMDGLEATRRIMACRPTPIVVVSCLDDADGVMSALRAGALSVVEKPAGGSVERYAALQARLCDQLVLMSQVRVIRRRVRGDQVHAPRAAPPPPSRPGGEGVKLVGVVASTGGPKALETVFGSLPADFPAAIVVVQHITASFFSGFVSWLDAQTALTVEAAEPGTRPRPGVILMAPPGSHTQVYHDRVRHDGGPPVSGQLPSGTVLFDSLARLGGEALGVVLTGMGDDGADGLLRMRQAGAWTLAEHESTSIVHGMPGAAIARGAAQEVVPLSGVAPRLLEIVGARV